MLHSLLQEDLDKYIDLIWKLAQDQTKSGYPTYTDGIKTKQDFILREKESFSRDNEEILLFEQNGQVEGWLHYCVIPQDSYLSLCTCNIRKDMKTALEEFLAYVKDRFPGNELYLGFPKCNTDAISLLQEQGFDCIEDSFNDVLFLDTYELLPEASQIVFKALLTKALNEGKRSGAKYFCFFTDQNSHPDSLELGFHPVGEYVCYWKKI